jgi:FlaA1/EpsC-like NDP-sugar epimerase
VRSAFEVEVNSFCGHNFSGVHTREFSKDNKLFGGNMVNAHQGKAVMVTGAGGSIGSQLARQIIDDLPKKLFIVDHCELSLFNILSELKQNSSIEEVEIQPVLINCASEDFCERFFDEKLDVIYHVAAYKHVNLSELNPSTYYQNNILATEYCQRVANSRGARFVLVSTDKAVIPTNVMGKSKRLCEMLALANANIENTVERTSIVRFGNVLNSSGSVLPIFRSQIAEGGPVTVTDRGAERFFMSISEATALVTDSTLVKSKHGIFVLDMGPSMNIHSLACNLIEQMGYRVTYNEAQNGEIEIKFIGLRPGEKMVEELSYGEVVETEVSRVRFANERTDFAEQERDLCLEFASGKRLDPPSGFDWEHGFLTAS